VRRLESGDIVTRKTVCVNDRDGDGDCAACAHNPEALCRVPLAARREAEVTDGLSARGAMHSALWAWFFSLGFDSAKADEVAKARIDDFAHALAEKQRRFAEQEDTHLRTTPASVYAQGIRDAAALIDPEVQS
jgi:hypothetical protein